MLAAVAAPIVKIDNPSIPIRSGHRLPMTSEPGAQMIGPKKNPSMKRLVPRRPTSLLTLNSSTA
jgi:hypothetical protein